MMRILLLDYSLHFSLFRVVVDHLLLRSSIYRWNVCLSFAHQGGSLEIVSTLVERGAQIQVPSTDVAGMYPLHWACTEGHLRVIIWVCCRLPVCLSATKRSTLSSATLISLCSFLNMGPILMPLISKDVRLWWLQLSMAVQNASSCSWSVVRILRFWTWMVTQLCIGRYVKQHLVCGW